MSCRKARCGGRAWCWPPRALGPPCSRCPLLGEPLSVQRPCGHRGLRSCGSSGPWDTALAHLWQCWCLPQEGHWLWMPWGKRGAPWAVPGWGLAATLRVSLPRSEEQMSLHSGSNPMSIAKLVGTPSSLGGWEGTASPRPEPVLRPALGWGHAGRTRRFQAPREARGHGALLVLLLSLREGLLGDGLDFSLILPSQGWPAHALQKVPQCWQKSREARVPGWSLQVLGPRGELPGINGGDQTGSVSGWGLP